MQDPQEFCANGKGIAPGSGVSNPGSERALIKAGEKKRAPIARGPF